MNTRDTADFEFKQLDRHSSAIDYDELSSWAEWSTRVTHEDASQEPAARNRQTSGSVTNDYAGDVEHDTRAQPSEAAGNTHPQRPALKGGEYLEADALELINDCYFMSVTDEEVAIYRVNQEGSATFTSDKEFKLHLANVRVYRKDVEKQVAASNFWLTHPQRRELRIVFDPRQTKPGEYNLWRGFAVKPSRGWDKLRRLLKHIYKVICRRDRRKFHYLMRWLAWAAQNPDKAPGTIIVLKSTAQGTGKTTLGVVMCEIFGRHGRRIDDKEHLLGQFNAELETTSFVLADEILWAGDARTADKLKSRITSDTVTVEAKFRMRREVRNRLHIIMTTNHEHAVPAGNRDRRFCVFDVSDEHAQDKAWFGPLYDDLAHGGKEQFLWLLLNLRLGDFHPRELVSTEEAIEQQRMSGDGVSQWCQACIYADAIIGPHGPLTSLGQHITSEQLRQSYTHYCQQHALRPASTGAFGKALASMFGPRTRPHANTAHSSANTSTTRPWGYSIPDAETWQDLVDQRLGINA